MKRIYCVSMEVAVMPSQIRFEHGFILELKRFTITSPDIKGLYITAPSRAEAEREAVAMVALIRAQEVERDDRRLASVTFETA